MCHHERSEIADWEALYETEDDEEAHETDDERVVPADD
jgi:hypothetical protein